MVRAYLAIMQTRLGARLAFAVDIPPDLDRLPVPPGMLITLVENAIKHGIEPLPAAARRGDGRAIRGDRLVVEAPTPARGSRSRRRGTGIGLANIRERLALLFGDRAALELAANAPRGFVARSVLPARRRGRHHPARPGGRR